MATESTKARLVDSLGHLAKDSEGKRKPPVKKGDTNGLSSDSKKVLVMPTVDVQKALAILEKGGSLQSIRFPSESASVTFLVVLTLQGEPDFTLEASRSLCSPGPTNYDRQWWISFLREHLSVND